MVDYYVKNEYMKTCGATDAPAAAVAAHNAEISYLSALKLRNFPTLQFEVWSG